jgi:hypothetical protein
MSNEISVEKYKKAYRELVLKKEKQGFTVHAVIYAGVNAGLIALNLLTVPQVLWFIFPLVGWGIGLAGHYFGVRRLPERLEGDEMKAEKIAQRNYPE